ncbi:MAG: histidine phosphatase family protein [Candidatus Eisenbacteria bacterium]|nr:histidine phosphatase family protein [Candidatus Eisenbacteria bacterium]
MSEAHHFTRFLLIRHAQARSADGLYGPDTPLSELGRKQAALLAGCFGLAIPISAVYCSPFPRAVQTAEPLAERLGLATQVDERVAELEVATAPLEVLTSGRDDTVLWRPDQRGAKDGETIAEFFSRVGRFCSDVCDRHRDQVVVVVSHAGAIDAIYRWALEIPPTSPWTFEVEVPNASVSEIEVWPHGRTDAGPPRRAVLHRIGDVRHLGECSSGL